MVYIYYYQVTRELGKFDWNDYTEGRRLVSELCFMLPGNYFSRDHLEGLDMYIRATLDESATWRCF
jgi:hypothetical protein